MKRLLELGASFSGGERDHLWLQGEGGRFTEVSGISGLDHPGDGRAAAWVDIDRDADPDLILASANAPFVQAFRNDLGHGRWLALRLVGGTSESGRRSNRDAIGAVIRLRSGNQQQVVERTAGSGFASQDGSWTVFGLGDTEVAANVEIRWPSGRIQHLQSLDAGGAFRVVEGSAPEPVPYR